MNVQVPGSCAFLKIQRTWRNRERNTISNKTHKKNLDMDIPFSIRCFVNVENIGVVSFSKKRQSIVCFIERASCQSTVRNNKR